MKVLPNEMQEVGLKKEEFREPLVKSASTTIKRDVWKLSLWAFRRSRRSHGKNNEVREESQAVENVNFNEDFGMYDILD